MDYIKKVEIRWSDLDPNFHLRHSVYYDLGAYCRVAFLNEQGITPEAMLKHSIGPILFREECIFKREINLGDEIFIHLKLQQASTDMRKWTMIHELWKANETLAAIITVEGAWMDTRLRKIVAPPEKFRAAFEALPTTEDFKMI